MSSVKLRAVASLQDGERLMVCGATEFLGMWNASKARKLNKVGHNQYEIEFDGDGYTVVQYKYCVRDPKGGHFVRWENGCNRQVNINSVKEDHAFEHGGGMWIACQFDSETEEAESTPEVENTSEEQTSPEESIPTEAQDTADATAEQVERGGEEENSTEGSSISTKEEAKEKWSEPDFAMSPVSSAGNLNHLDGKYLDSIAKDETITAKNGRRMPMMVLVSAAAAGAVFVLKARN
mmetsp:Transcript_12131/g.36983  ORF Transcript_12131/g.36983 Transcript_12131/m.36983 type:complete len:236 (+) Transcript_12131:212-919(+)|eukprot:CAMPEP_0198724252 /NCGR_PEP_ID=MMETSP1475-20131203/1751_1 /TAXON_ID= ORGANISM="Unidentified sp., Strain CCMP1999" /NCGR_SAMPLE_ID=MMETSP1475 /ASSEMBLY_ACC=CAM_ASM_001111 /LENGTH=235 /DNA_ID=CAMNT_0044485729 /DNA_START=195 /DNA_END=902 /DNA_ORIENTATION=+